MSCQRVVCPENVLLQYDSTFQVRYRKHLTFYKFWIRDSDFGLDLVLGLFVNSLPNIDFYPCIKKCYQDFETKYCNVKNITLKLAFTNYMYYIWKNTFKVHKCKYLTIMHNFQQIALWILKTVLQVTNIVKI